MQSVPMGTMILAESKGRREAIVQDEEGIYHFREK